MLWSASALPRVSPSFRAISLNAFRALLDILALYPIPLAYSICLRILSLLLSSFFFFVLLPASCLRPPSSVPSSSSPSFPFPIPTTLKSGSLTPFSSQTTDCKSAHSAIRPPRTTPADRRSQTPTPGTSRRAKEEEEAAVSASPPTPAEPALAVCCSAPREEEAQDTCAISDFSLLSAASLPRERTDAGHTRRDDTVTPQTLKQHLPRYRAPSAAAAGAMETSLRYGITKTPATSSRRPAPTPATICRSHRHHPPSAIHRREEACSACRARLGPHDSLIPPASANRRPPSLPPGEEARSYTAPSTPRPTTPASGHEEARRWARCAFDLARA
ncbi:hypothetical protein C8R47DRAFT_1226007 [Mycena vitilis]|nr:hypothetical protein C8R47DRAFT_1226007 [Mycena vitilis]